MTQIDAHMIPIKSCKTAELNEVCGLALLLPTDEFGAKFLVTSHDESMAVFLGGDYVHHAFPTAQTANWKGLVIENVEIEVDLASIYSLEKEEPYLGSIILDGSSVKIVARVKNGGWTETRAVALNNGECTETSSTRVGFTRWQAIMRDGDVLRVVHESNIERKV